jgi:hypothetical protein
MITATLKQLKESGVAGRLGMSPCDPEFVSLVNRAQDDLMSAGRWWGTYRRIRICSSANCIVWPREVRNIESLSVADQVLPVRNAWFEFQEYVRPPGLSAKDYDGINQLLDRGTTPVFLEPVGTNKKLRLYAASATDYGKRLLIDGYDANGQRIRTFDATENIWVDGEYVTLAAPFVTTSNFFKAPILGVQKGVTDNTVRMYTVDGSTGEEVLIGYYQGNETNPNYRKSYITNQFCPPPPNLNDEPDGCTTQPGCGRPLFTAIARLEFIPVINDPDWLMIGNIGAIEGAMQAMKNRTAENYGQYQKMWSDAIQGLRSWSESYSGQREKTVISCPPYGAANLEYITGGFW